MNFRGKKSTSSHGTNQPTFLVNALQPAEVSKVVLDEEAVKLSLLSQKSSYRLRLVAVAKTCVLQAN